MLSLLVEAFILGLVGGAVPGPILTGTFTEILNSGFLKGLRVVFYALIIESVGALMAIFIVFSLGLPQIVFQVISVLGSAVLFWLAWNIWQIKEINTEKHQILSFNKVVLLTAFNSGYWIFWLTVGISRASVLDKIFPGGEFIFLLIFEFAWLLATVGLAAIFAVFRPLLHRRNLVGATFKFLAFVLVFLGIRTLLKAF